MFTQHRQPAGIPRRDGTGLPVFRGVYLSATCCFSGCLNRYFSALPFPAVLTMLLLAAAVWLLSVLLSALLRQVPVIRFITLGERFRS